MTRETDEFSHLNPAISAGLTAAIASSHGRSRQAGWWTDIKTGEDLRTAPRIRQEKLLLMHSELSEAMEGIRKGLMDEKLPHRTMEEVELADLFIRLADYCGAFGIDLAGAVIEKMEYNAHRADHKLENRKAEGGKAF